MVSRLATQPRCYLGVIRLLVAPLTRNIDEQETHAMTTTTEPRNVPLPAGATVLGL
jgi:hypothetical protein